MIFSGKRRKTFKQLQEMSISATNILKNKEDGLKGIK